MLDIPGLERRTKIVATIGPASASRTQLRALLERGMHVAVRAGVRALSEALDGPTAIVQDLGGPKVRIGTLAHGSVELEPGRRFTLTTSPVEGSRDRVSLSYAQLPAEVRIGDPLLLADRVIHLRVERVTEAEIQCEVIVGGRLGSHKGVNVPSGLPGRPILGDKDLGDLRVGLAQGIDYIGLSFVRSAEDVRAARAHIERLGGHVPVIAKIETQLVDGELHVLLQGALGAEPDRAADGLADRLVRPVGRPPAGQRAPAHHEVAGPVDEPDQEIMLAGQRHETVGIDRADVAPVPRRNRPGLVLEDGWDLEGGAVPPRLAPRPISGERADRWPRPGPGPPPQ